MLTVNWNCYHYYQKNLKGPGGACVRRRGRLCHGTMAQWPVQAWSRVDDDSAVAVDRQTDRQRQFEARGSTEWTDETTAERYRTVANVAHLSPCVTAAAAAAAKRQLNTSYWFSLIFFRVRLSRVWLLCHVGIELQLDHHHTTSCGCCL